MGSGGNEKLPPRRIPTVEIVWNVMLTRTQLTHKHPHHGGAVCPFYGVVSGIFGYTQSDAGNLFQRGWPRALTLGLIKIVKITG